MIDKLIRESFCIINKDSDRFWFVLYKDRLFQINNNDGNVDISNVINHNKLGKTEKIYFDSIDIISENLINKISNILDSFIK